MQQSRSIASSLAKSVLERPPMEVGQYLAAFKLSAIYIAASGEICLGDSPADDATAIWWTPDRDRANRVVRLAKKDTGDPAMAVINAGRQLGIALTPHATVMARAGASVARIEDAVERLRRSGQLQVFNAEYKRRRQAAQAAGRSFMPYGAATRRLRAVLAGRIAGELSGATLTASIMDEALGS